MLHAAQDELFDAAVFPHAVCLLVDLGVHLVHHLREGLQLGIRRGNGLPARARRLLRELFHGAEDEGGRQPGDEQAGEDIDEQYPDDGGQRLREDGIAGRAFRREADEEALCFPAARKGGALLVQAAVIHEVGAQRFAAAHGKALPSRKGGLHFLAVGVVFKLRGLRVRIADGGAVFQKKSDPRAEQLLGKRAGAFVAERGGRVKLCDIRLQAAFRFGDGYAVIDLRKEHGHQKDADHRYEQGDEQDPLSHSLLR